MKAFAIVAVAVLMTATGALAADPDDGDRAAQQEKKICRSEKMTGSLTRVRRICMTQHEWDDLAQRNNRDINDRVRQAGRTDSPVPAGAGG